MSVKRILAITDFLKSFTYSSVKSIRKLFYGFLSKSKVNDA